METLASAGFTVPPASSIDALWARSTTVSCDANERLSLDLLSLLGELASFVDGKCDLPFVPTKPSQDSRMLHSLHVICVFVSPLQVMMFMLIG
jgi:hypothetical protein